MEILFVAGFAPIVPDPIAGRTFYQEALGLPLKTVEGDYIAVDGFEGSKHLGVWPLADAAQSCFGASEWPDDIPVPQASIEFEVSDVQAAAAELTARGYDLIHEVRPDPRGTNRALGSGHRPTIGARRPAGGRVLVPVDAR